MKNKLKGFTLVELIVVMAIMAILMLGIMQMFKPIREVYVDTTQYEAQRTAQNGIVQYITESVRYATDLGIYNQSTSSASAAVENFAVEYCKAAGILDKTSGSPISPYTAADATKIKDEIKKYAEVMIIDNSTEHEYNSKDYVGRIIRRKVNMTSPSLIGTDPDINVGTAKMIASTDANWRTALGEAYYGSNTYQINLAITDKNGDKKSDDGMLNVTVYSTRNGKRDISDVGNETTVTTNITRGGVLCRNLVSSNDKGVNKVGIFDITKYSGNSATSGLKTYVVFLNNDQNKREKDAVEKVVKAVQDSHVTP